ncbi:hypothetical protein CBM2592_B10058 [Cupriavidus taiwanensis]|nr:hypothetical protein CBM2588_B10057 [Cupriavidus taiwanensis]SOY59794.1 hypothetical protein CBM2592_B10058 [Cupriavidus taiwanensis]SOY91834.1 hypothetical protein CBM2591_B10058 [Cupriavidus taiwanensis]SOZ73495.1 hypothetical protein CBM2617_B190058 [Cupriavidus taiwanensis]SOZ83384.1 hypothetical protein CBM2618_B10058 [Cupriavidus taiwanensis]
MPRAARTGIFWRPPCRTARESHAARCRRGRHATPHRVRRTLAAYRGHGGPAGGAGVHANGRMSLGGRPRRRGGGDHQRRARQQRLGRALPRLCRSARAAGHRRGRRDPAPMGPGLAVLCPARDRQGL